jgi:phytoene dehydrogenase-like protein
MKRDFDVVVVGGGHNGLVAASYLAKAGKKVALVEARASLGGASISYQAFPEFPVKLSRYSYLVSLFPDEIKRDLGLTFKTLSRKVSSYTPVAQDGRDIGLLVERNPARATEESFRAVTGTNSEFVAWQEFYGALEELAKYLAPTLLQPLQNEHEVRNGFGNQGIWQELFKQPIGRTISDRFKDDIVRGVVLTDALVGTFSSVDDLQANACFLYHIIGNGTGEWRVPQGGMGAIVRELERVARNSGVVIETNQRIDGIDGDKSGVALTTTDGAKFFCQDLVWCADDRTLSRLLNQEPKVRRDGSQIKINMLLRELPQLKSGLNPAEAFAGTFHIDESAIQLESAFQLSSAGSLPQIIPSEVYCHSLTDPSIVGETGLHTLTLFAFHTPASLFDTDRQLMTAKAVERIISGMNSYLTTPLEDVLAYDSQGRACLEVKNPLDLEEEIDLPRGNIFHGDLTMPFAPLEPSARSLIEGSWGSETAHPHIFIGGASAIRGGGVSGIAGHNAAFAIINRR